MTSPTADLAATARNIRRYALRMGAVQGHAVCRAVKQWLEWGIALATKE